ncbi:MAG TPA: cytochrome c-type biogenesis protein [Burkholderiaceae bacterium]|nr:cytochrome c-type biogenesis protein [Burkholderiaceae bacterium]
MKRLVALALAAAGTVAQAAEAQPVAADPQLEVRVDELAAQLRCLVCQNQSLADSHAELALDLKNQVREQLKAGRSADEVLAYMTQRYGDFVLYKPPWKGSTVLLWAGPALLVLLGVGLGWRAVSRQARRPAREEPDVTA